MSDSDLKDYILARVVVDGNGCWLWTGARDGGGYGVCTKPGTGKSFRPHRVAFEGFKGPIPPGKQVCHSCDVRHCCNPGHLWLGSPAENTQDMHRKGRAKPGRACKLTSAQVEEIQQLLGSVPQRTIAEKFGVARTTISAISTGRSWKNE